MCSTGKEIEVISYKVCGNIFCGFGAWGSGGVRLERSGKNVQEVLWRMAD